MAHRVHGGPLDDDRVARHHDRQRLAPPHDGESRGNTGRDCVGGDGVRVRQRDRCTHGELVFDRLRAAQLLRRLDRLVHRVLLLLRERQHPLGTGVLPLPPRRRRGRADGHLSVDPDRNVPAGGVGGRHRPLRVGRGGRTDDRSDAWGMDYRQLLVAVDFLHQSTDWYVRCHHEPAVHPRSAREACRRGNFCCSFPPC